MEILKYSQKLLLNLAAIMQEFLVSQVSILNFQQNIIIEKVSVFVLMLMINLILDKNLFVIFAIELVYHLFKVHLLDLQLMEIYMDYIL